MTDNYHEIDYQNCNENSKRKILLYLQLNRHFWRPAELYGNMTGVYWTTGYQMVKALNELVQSGLLEKKLMSKGWFHYFAYRAIKEITLEQYKSEDK